MKTLLHLLWELKPLGAEYNNSFRSKHLKHDRMLTDLPMYKTMQQNVDSRSLSVKVGQPTSWHCCQIVHLTQLPKGASRRTNAERHGNHAGDNRSGGGASMKHRRDGRVGGEERETEGPQGSGSDQHRCASDSVTFQTIKCPLTGTSETASSPLLMGSIARTRTDGSHLALSRLSVQTL